MATAVLWKGAYSQSPTRYQEGFYLAGRDGFSQYTHEDRSRLEKGCGPTGMCPRPILNSEAMGMAPRGEVLQDGEGGTPRTEAAARCRCGPLCREAAAPSHGRRVSRTRDSSQLHKIEKLNKNEQWTAPLKA